MKAQHTPGPWITLDTGLDVFVDTNKDPQMLPKFRHIAAVITTCQFDQEARANANLIMAAPELLAALELIYSNAGESVEFIRRHCSAAISKAKGGSQ